MSNHDPLRDALRHRAEELGDPHPFTLDDVKGRARGIRRRRAAVTGLAAAAVLAVAVPTGLTVTDRVGSPDRAPVAGASATPSEGGSSTPAPTGPHRVTLTTDRPVTAETPGVAFLYDGLIMEGDYRLAVEEDYTEFAPVGGGWVGVRRDDEGKAFVDLLDSEGEVLVSAPSTGSLAASGNGTVAVYATPDGELMTVTPEAGRMSLVDPAALPSGILEPVAVTGSDSCDQDAAGGGCAVFFDSQDGAEQRAWSATAKGIVSEFPDLLSLGGMSPDGSLSGVTSVSEDNSACSAVLGPDWEKSWETCDYTLGQFSPDGRYVIGHPAQRSGIGDSSVAILDARTGDLLAEFANSETNPAFIDNVVWDADNTLVATVFEDTWSLMRMTPDGKLTAMAGGNSDNIDEVPIVFATQP